MSAARVARGETARATARAAPLSALQKSARRTADDNAAALVAAGVSALAQGDEATAKRHFQRALQSEPGNATAHTYLGVLADRAGALPEAATHFAAAVKSTPRSPQALNNYGAILFRMGRTKEAAAEFEASLKLDAQQSSALVNLAQIRFASGTASDLQATRELFERARAIAPDADIARSLTIIALRLGNREAAITYYREYASHLSALSAGENYPADARGELGGALLDAGLYDEAIAELRAVVAVEPSNAGALVSLAAGYRARKDVAAAGRLLEEAVARGATDARVYFALADLYESIGRVENAIPVMRLAVERAPANEDYRFRYALLLINSQAPKAAAIRVREALAIFPKSAKLWFALGLSFMTEHQGEPAAEALKHAVELDPRAAPALAYLGLAYAEQGRYDEAIVYYERAAAINDQLATVHYLLADVLLKQKPTETAAPEKLLRRAIALDPTLTSARLALGKIYLRAENFEAAAEQLTSVVGLDPNLAEAYYQLGRAYTRLKRPAEAQAALDTFKRLNEGQKEQAQNERKDIVRRLAKVNF